MENTLLTANATLPTYDRSALIPRIVHLGFGAFHRAHQAVYADILASEHGSDWGYTEVNLIGGEQQIADLQQQDLLYTVAEMSADAWTARVVGVVKQALHAGVDGLEAVIAADLHNPHQPKSAAGVVVEALSRRRAAGLPAFREAGRPPPANAKLPLSAPPFFLFLYAIKAPIPTMDTTS